MARVDDCSFKSWTAISRYTCDGTRQGTKVVSNLHAAVKHRVKAPFDLGIAVTSFKLYFDG